MTDYIMAAFLMCFALVGAALTVLGIYLIVRDATAQIMEAL